MRAAQEPAATGVATPWRADFPALDQSVNGFPLAYLDSAATTQRPASVLTALEHYHRHDNANPGGALHALARRAYERYEGARRVLADFIHAQSPDEVVWVRGTTEGINLVASAWARPRLRPGDEILLTVAEHASNLLPWRLVAEQTGAIIRYADVDDEGRVRVEDFERQLSARTRIASFSHVSNVAGYINPAAEICSLARRAGARVLIDAAQSAPHVPLDVQALSCDFLVLSSHKMLGPMGAGVLWGARERHEAQLTEHGLDRLSRIKGLRLLGPRSPQRRLPVFSFAIAGRTPGEILTHLDTRGIAVRAGDLAALPLLKRLGVAEAVRASCYIYTETSELDRLADALDLASQKHGE
ncbi:MAG TPA: aminotransferase class V-fold PLP-dependent enzyme [Steroidobacteraceae bacterium]|nr:aminotransferase class V-fold PLP-dependent enzyme [Steroidobacteraceae bacterium]